MPKGCAGGQTGLWERMGAGGKGLGLAREALPLSASGFQGRVLCLPPIPYQNTGPATGSFLCPPRPLCTNPSQGTLGLSRTTPNPHPQRNCGPLLGLLTRQPPASSPWEPLRAPSPEPGSLGLSHRRAHTFTQARACAHSLHTHAPVSPAHTWPTPLPPSRLGSRHPAQPLSPATHPKPGSVTTKHDLAAWGLVLTEERALPRRCREGPVTFQRPI